MDSETRNQQFKLKYKYFNAGEGSHIPLLIKIMEMSKGDVLELGTGLNSTPVLHWLCNQEDRKIDSYESSDMFYNVLQNYETDWHGIHKVEDWDKDFKVDKHWGLAFIDHAPGPRRNVEMGRLAQNADFLVVHDTEPNSDWHYNFSNHFDKYKYRYNYTKAYPHTSVFSNFNNLKELENLCK